MPEQPAGRSAGDPLHTRLDAYAERYAARTRGMKASEIRALFAVASRPEVVSLAGGMPNIGGLGLEALGETIRQLVVDSGTSALQYSSGQGDPRLREHICDVMALEGATAHPDDVVVTVGSQQAVDLVTRVFCDPGDVVLCEAPSYVGALGVFSGYECEVVHVEMDEHGLIPEALSSTLTRMSAAGRRVKLLYTVPTFHNPAGVTMSAARRGEVLHICQAADVLILEDNPYGLLGFDVDPLPTLHSHEPSRVVYLGTFSKTFAPGLRVGWAVAPLAVRDKLVLAQESATLCPPTFSQQVVARYLERQDWQQQVKDFRLLYHERRDALLRALDEYLPTASWTVPDGGFYVWVTLPDHLDATAMLPRAVGERVAYVPGTAFFADGGGRNQMRLSYCHPTPERLVEGVRRLAGVVEAERELQAMFGSTSAPRRPGGYQRPHPDVG
ncbi:MAG: 2-aminoadipate transaminase [Nocardioidaceae bacterium]|jgi:2-aminoadipate transaminase|nr:2-aminoadipate transaminase [Nocardioidaceae bacterium]